MADSFNDVFGSYTVPPAEQALSGIAFTDLATLVWPTMFSGQVPGEYVAAGIVQLYGNAGAVVLLPPANAVSVGQDLLLRNTGTEDLAVRNADNEAVTTLAAGAVK